MLIDDLNDKCLIVFNNDLGFAIFILLFEDNSNNTTLTNKDKQNENNIYNVLIILVTILALSVVTIVTINYASMFSPLILLFLGLGIGAAYVWTIDLISITISNYKQNKHETFNY